VRQPTHFSKVSPSHKHAEPPPPKEALSTLFSAEEKIKVFEFKSQKGMLSKVKNMCLAMLRGVGHSTHTATPRSEPGDPAKVRTENSKML
jgi:hypothetical protein